MSARGPFVALLTLAFVACHEPPPRYEPADGTNAVDLARIAAFVDELNPRPTKELWRLMDETDFDRRAAAARLLLERDGIEVSERGVTQIRWKYLQDTDPRRVDYGFALLGCLAAHDVATDAIRAEILAWVEAHPQDAIADRALWALGETGRDDAIEDFLRIAGERDRYGAKARERSFCCMAQCGRYSAKTRFELVPRVLALADKVGDDADSRRWCLMALHDMTPGVRLDSIDAYRVWWEEQR